MEEGQTVTVTCVRSLDLTLQSTISVVSQDGTAIGENSHITSGGSRGSSLGSDEPPF